MQYQVYDIAHTINPFPHMLGGGSFYAPLKFFANISKTAAGSAIVFGIPVYTSFPNVSDPSHSKSGHQVTSSDLTSEQV